PASPGGAQAGARNGARAARAAATPVCAAPARAGPARGPQRAIGGVAYNLRTYVVVLSSTFSPAFAPVPNLLSVFRFFALRAKKRNTKGRYCDISFMSSSINRSCEQDSAGCASAAAPDWLDHRGSVPPRA